MRLWGRTLIGATPVELGANVKRVYRTNFDRAGRVAKVSAYMDGLGSGVGSQSVRAVIYSAAGNLLATSDEVVIADGQAAGWVDFKFAALTKASYEVLAAADHDLGLHGGATATARVYADAIAGTAGQWNADTYSDGASATFGASTSTTDALSLFATYFIPWKAPLADDLYYGRLPFAEAQAVFASTGPLTQTRRQVRVGWHNTNLDREDGSFAIVRTGGSVAHLLGERVRVSFRRGGTLVIVYAYVHNETELLDDDSDLSLSQLLFARVASLSEDYVVADVEVMG